jgi:hypothetical protein
MPGGTTIRGSSMTDYPLCTAAKGERGDPSALGDGKTVQRLAEGFRQRWTAGPPQYIRVRARTRQRAKGRQPLSDAEV